MNTKTNTISFVNSTLFQMKRGLRFSVYCQAGIQVIDDGNANAVVVDLIRQKFYEIYDSNYNYMMIWGQVRPSQYGMTLPDRNLVQIMGRNDAGLFLKAREDFYSQWREREFGHPNFPI